MASLNHRLHKAFVIWWGLSCLIQLRVHRIVKLRLINISILIANSRDNMRFMGIEIGRFDKWDHVGSQFSKLCVKGLCH